MGSVVCCIEDRNAVPRLDLEHESDPMFLLMAPKRLDSTGAHSNKSLKHDVLTSLVNDHLEQFDCSSAPDVHEIQPHLSPFDNQVVFVVSLLTLLSRTKTIFTGRSFSSWRRRGEMDTFGRVN